MIADTLKQLKEFILSKNTYLTKGYDSAYVDSEGNINDGKEAIFPDDQLGNYFYLRLPKNITFNYDNNFKVNDCDRPLVTNTQVILVCCMRDADPDLLMGNLLSTVQKFDPLITIQSGILKSEEVVTQELSKIKKENLQAAFQRLDANYTIISITFMMSAGFQFSKLTCLTNPCKSC